MNQEYHICSIFIDRTDGLDKAGAFDEIVKILDTEIKDAEKEDSYYETDWASIEFEVNCDFDRSQASNEKSGFIFYPYDIVYSCDISLKQSDEFYVDKLSPILKALRDNDYKAVIACDFEDRFTDPYNEIQ